MPKRRSDEARVRVLAAVAANDPPASADHRHDDEARMPSAVAANDPSVPAAVAANNPPAALARFVMPAEDNLKDYLRMLKCDAALSREIQETSAGPSEQPPAEEDVFAYKKRLRGLFAVMKLAKQLAKLQAADEVAEIAEQGITVVQHDNLSAWDRAARYCASLGAERTEPASILSLGAESDLRAQHVLPKRDDECLGREETTADKSIAYNA